MQQLLKKIILSVEYYPRFLNTLSLLEYIGARKIIKSQNQHHLTEKLLAHIAEEIRHAQVLKRAALKLSPACNSYAPETLLCGNEAYHYFQTVDHAPLNQLGEEDPWRCYVYTTLLIEIRALDFYSAFEQSLKELGKPSVFRGILAEEERHLQDIQEWLHTIPNHESNLQQLKTIESQQFTLFLQAIEKKVNLEIAMQAALTLT